MIGTDETYKAYVTLAFAKGALLADPAKIVNVGLECNLPSAIDIYARRGNPNLDSWFGQWRGSVLNTVCCGNTDH